MRLPDAVRRLLLRAALRVIARRDPDFVLPDYLMRWHLLRSKRWGCLYVHVITGSDDDRALHDHRAWNISVVLSGGYVEHLPVPRWQRAVMAGDVVARRATTPHRLQLIDGAPVITLFVTGPHQRNWGFWTREGWVPHEQFAQERVTE